jgi:NADH-quinone oxidoreductase subunit L
MVFKNRFIGEGMDEFWKGALAHGPNNHIMHDIHNAPGWVQNSPFVMLVLGFLVAYWMYI